jgi:hypothetical protein
VDAGIVLSLFTPPGGGALPLSHDGPVSGAASAGAVREHVRPPSVPRIQDA